MDLNSLKLLNFNWHSRRFVDTYPPAEQAALQCSGIRSYYERSKQAWAAGDAALALGLLELAANQSSTVNNQARALYMAVLVAMDFDLTEVAERYAALGYILCPDNENIARIYQNLGRPCLPDMPSVDPAGDIDPGWSAGEWAEYVCENLNLQSTDKLLNMNADQQQQARNVLLESSRQQLETLGAADRSQA